MAFVDTMLDETDAHFVIVDRHHLPGGHWNDAYSFVNLHQPSAFYGVASYELGGNRIDETGSNQGYYELASGAEVSAYFDRVMRERFLASGRVQYFPMCEYVGDDTFRSLLSGDEYTVKVRKKLVDCTFFNTSVPSTHERKFEVDDSVVCITPNELPGRAGSYGRYTILGGGKTAMDAAVWLLENGADPETITWVYPRDSWLINRNVTQPGVKFAERRLGGFVAQLEAMQAATSVDDLFERLEAAGVMLRIDQSATPTMLHYATVSQGEVDQLRRIENVVRQGRVAQVAAEELTMEDGTSIPAEGSTLNVDCTATAVQFGAKTVPVFADNRITPQAVIAPLAATSAALTAYVEANFDSEEEKNRLCTPVTLADTPAEWIRSFMANTMNQNTWVQHPGLQAWYAKCRLNPNRSMPGDPELPDAAQAGGKDSIGPLIKAAMGNLQKLLTGLRF